MIRKKKFLIVVLVFFWLIIAWILCSSIQKNQGNLVYALDDPYIHMAIAKNFSQHGVWGVTRYEFTNSSSSILWPMLLMLIYKIVGVNATIPLILNIVLATLFICLIHAAMKKRGIDPFFIALSLVVMILVTPLPALVFTGMEHVLHILVAVFFILAAARILSEEKEKLCCEYYYLYLFAPFLTAIRYEGCFLVFIVAVFFIMKKEFKQAVIVSFAGAIPILFFGFVSLHNGWHFLPNSLLLKASFPKLSSISSIIHSLGYSAIQNIYNHSQIMWLVVFGSLLFIYNFNKLKIRFWQESNILLLFLVCISLMQMQFADLSLFYRHDAYLVMIGLIVFTISLFDIWPSCGHITLDKKNAPVYGLACLICLLVIVPFVGRIKSIAVTIQATTNIFQQQYQTSMFLARFYQGQTVAANDIGAITFYSEIKLFDVYGLGTLAVEKYKSANSFYTETIYQLGEKTGSKIAILYEDWFADLGGLPKPWAKVGEWTIKNNVVCGGETVTFYAVDSKERDVLINNLKMFSTRLPSSMIQSGEYSK